MKKVSKKALNKSFLSWFYGNLTCFSQEHMQTFGYLCAMLPVVEELYDTKEEQKDAMQTYTAFFNTEPQIGTLVVGMTAGLEEAKANGEAIDGETINGIRAGLMGPLAGIGDSLIVGTLIPILLGIALGLSGNGSPLGAEDEGDRFGPGTGFAVVVDSNGTLLVFAVLDIDMVRFVPDPESESDPLSQASSSAHSTDA